MGLLTNRTFKNKRYIMKRKVLLCLFLCCIFSLSAQQKNILLITVDDLNDWVGAFGGHPQTKTPNIDALAAKATVFTNASCPTPVCNPSRTAFMIGRRPHETGIMSNGDGYFRKDGANWVKNITSVPQYFAQKGYKTAAQGKIFHTHNESKGEFQKVGPGGQGCNAGSSVEKVPNTKIEWSKSNQTLTQTGDYKSAKWCGDYIKETHNKPFFLACGIFRPHLPWHAPKEFYDKMPAVNDIILPPYLKNDRNDTYGGSNKVLDEVLKNGGEKRWKESVQAYLANVAFADACVGKLLNDLKNSAYANNTIVVLIGDHGWHLGEKDHFQKFTMWDRAVKTPMIIYDPVDGQAGYCDKAVSLMDIFPTLLDLTKTAKPTFEVDGRSIGDLVKNPETDWCGVALTSYGGGDHSIRTDRYRYIKFKSGKEELYDHEVDPNEWTNVAAKTSYKDIRDEHRQILNKMLNNEENPITGCEVTPPGGGTPVDITDLTLDLSSCPTVSLNWGDVEGETAYRIRRKVQGDATFTNITDVPANTIRYDDISAKTGIIYIYQVRPVVNGAAVKSSNQPTIQVDCGTLPKDCAGVEGGTANIDACGICSGGTTGITPSSPKTWYADLDEDGFGDPTESIDACSQPSGYVLNSNDECPNDATNSCTDPQPCTINVSAVASDVTCNQNGTVSLSVADYGARTNIKYQLGNGNLSSNKSTSSTYTINNVASGNYTVYAQWGNGDCPNTNVGVVIVNNTCDNSGEPVNIENLTAELTSNCGVKLEWEDVSGETEYRIRRKEQGQSTYQNITDVNANITSYIDNTVQTGKTYVYQVRPVVDNKAVKISNNPVITTSCSNTSKLSQENVVRFAIYPSPAENYITIQGAEEGEYVQILTINGQLVKEASVVNGKVNISELAADTYLARIQGKIIKFIKM